MLLLTLSRGARGYRRYIGELVPRRPSWKNERATRRTYEKQNESACAVAPVLSEAPGAFLHFHPPPAPIPFTTSPTFAHPLAPRVLGLLPPLAALPRHASPHAVSHAPSRPRRSSASARPFTEQRLRRFCLLQPLSAGQRHSRFAFLCFNTFLNERKNKYRILIRSRSRC